MQPPNNTNEGRHDPRRYAPAAARNRAVILEILHAHVPQSGTLLEIASGSGEHAAFCAPKMPQALHWQPSDGDPAACASIDAHAAASGCPRIAPALTLDVSAATWPVDQATAIFCANMIHIAPFSAAQGLIAGAGRLLPTGGPLILYGPFKRAGQHTAASNAAFDESLRERDARWGVRDLEGDIVPLATAAGLKLATIEEMPANNLIVIFHRDL